MKNNNSLGSLITGVSNFPFISLSGAFPPIEAEEQKQIRLLEEKRLLKEKVNKFKAISLTPKAQ